MKLSLWHCAKCLRRAKALDLHSVHVVTLIPGLSHFTHHTMFSKSENGPGWHWTHPLKIKKVKKASLPSQTLIKSAMSHPCPWLYSFQGSVFLCPWKCTLNINTAFTVTFHQFNDYTIFKDTFCCYVLYPYCSYLPFFDRIVAKTDHSLFEPEIVSGYMTAWNFAFSKWQTFSLSSCYQSDALLCSTLCCLIHSSSFVTDPLSHLTVSTGPRDLLKLCWISW